MKEIKNTTANYTLRLPCSLKTEVERLAAQDGISVNQFITTAVAEKISAIKTSDFFLERKKKADFTVFHRILNRSGGEPPQPGDEYNSCDVET
ncbi:toxin-antitoxin system HicB family antitoxin [Iningainema tapete]|uniref:Toxin-antitoxin system HicB family antitoxin n=1 Tax=Iningainema tapete BLCC-T55 TaxID=2748662 RepID=A0A8J6XEV7_9CYAN|nr:toxin-antitoxin system HicB family antitoxin [Iningainema tapete]MBD2775265.1 toxin-antitoxin system HicB family antitoxin [Iningainema tapete BLCC-T55]